jgi:cytochrome c oxidase assembly factor CtaG
VAIGAWRVAGSVLGLLSIWIAVASPLASGDAHLLTVHMIQHLLLMSVAPPLIWLGRPRRLLRRDVRWGPVHRLGRRLGHPVLCWLAATTVLVFWHVPAALTLGARSPVWHAIEHASFLAGGLLFWWPVVQARPASSTESWSIVLYLFLATLPCDALSGFLVFSERIAYPMYLSPHRHATLSVIDDQQLAGAVMWTAVTIIYFVAAAIVATRALLPGSPVVEGAGHARPVPVLR